MVRRVFVFRKRQFDRAIEIRDKMQGKDHPGLEQVLTQRGLALVRSGRADDGLASIYRNVQGLADDAESAESKREMLQILFEANMELKSQLAGSR